MADDDDSTIYVDVAARLDEASAEKVTGRLRDKLKDGARGAGKAISDVLHSELAEELGRAVAPAARDAGIQLGKELGSQAGKFLHDEISDVLGSVGVDFDGVLDKAHELSDAFGIDADKVFEIGDAFKNLKAGDTAKGFQDLSKALSGMPGPLGEVGDKSKGLLDTYNGLKGNVKDVSGLLTTFEKDAPGIAGALGTVGAAAESMAGPLAAAAAAAMEIDKALHIDSNTFDPGKHGWWHTFFGKVPDWLGITDPSTGLDKHDLPNLPSSHSPANSLPPGSPNSVLPPPGTVAGPGTKGLLPGQVAPTPGAHTSSFTSGAGSHVSLVDRTTPILPGGPSPDTPQAIAQYIYQAAASRGYSPHDATAIVAYSIGESGLNPRISGGVQGDDEVIGLFQEKSGFARSGGIDPSQRGTVAGNVSAYLNNLDKHRGSGDIYDQLLATSVGGPMYTGGRGYMDQLMGRARGYLGSTAPAGFSTGGPPASPAGFGSPNLPGSPALPGLGAVPPPPTQGNTYTPQDQQSLGHGSGVGVSGGAIGLAEQAGAMAAGAFSFGGGAIAAQIAEQEMNLAIQKGGQIAATAAMAPMETFGLAGGQMGAPSVQKGGWYKKIVGGLMGQQTNIPNVAGATQPPKQPKQKGEGDDGAPGDDQSQSGQGQQGQGGSAGGPKGSQDDPMHVKVTNPAPPPPQGSATSAMNTSGVMSAMTA